LWEQTSFRRRTHRGGASLIYSPGPEGVLNTSVPQVITVHDIIPVKYPELHPRMKYYYCTNCGYNGDFGFYRQKNLSCDICRYTHISEMTPGEYQSWAKKHYEEQSKDVFYQSKGEITYMTRKKNGILPV